MKRGLSRVPSRLLTWRWRVGIRRTNRWLEVSPGFAEWRASEDVRPLIEGWVELMGGAVRGDYVILSIVENSALRLIPIFPDDAWLKKIERAIMRRDVFAGRERLRSKPRQARFVRLRTNPERQKMDSQKLVAKRPRGLRFQADHYPLN